MNIQVSKIESLNGIRGFAVLLVLLSHASYKGIYLHPVLSFEGAGRYGVFLFFVLSSFLLTRQFLEIAPAGKELKTFLGHYFVRRVLRIFPLYVAALTVYYLLYQQGIIIYRISLEELFDSFLLLEGKGIFWTIPVEFQYYFVLPFVALILLHVKHIVPVLVFILAISIVWPWFVEPEYVPNLLPFLPFFLLGSGTAAISHYLNQVEQKSEWRYLPLMYNLVAWVAFALFFVFVPNFYNLIFSQQIASDTFHKQFLLFSMLGCVLVISIVHGNGILKKLMEHKIMVFWGKVSFSAYLGHMIILEFFDYYRFNMALMFVVFITVTGLLSYLSFRFFEMPLSKASHIKGIYSRVCLFLRIPGTTR